VHCGPDEERPCYDAHHQGLHSPEEAAIIITIIMLLSESQAF
jgi:hypothetical protein